MDRTLRKGGRYFRGGGRAFCLKRKNRKNMKKNNLTKEMEFNDSEHKAGYHQTFTKHCYECEKQNRLIQAFRTVNQKLYRAFPSDNEALHNPYGENYPLGYSPE